MASKAKFQKGLCCCGPLSLLMLDYMFFIDLQLAQRDQTDPGANLCGTPSVVQAFC